jgi:hypothetical protein
MTIVAVVLFLLALWSLIAASNDPKFGGLKTAVIVTDVVLIVCIAFGSGIVKF